MAIYAIMFDMISIVLPAYREEENLVNILPRINKVMTENSLDYEVLVVDTLEPIDNTAKVCEENNVRYNPRRGGNNYGDAIRTGFADAKGEFTVVMDADGSHDPEKIIEFYKTINEQNADLIIGSRYCKGGYTDNNFILKFMSWALNVTYRIFFGLKVKDVSDSFRMYRSEQIKALSLECDNFDIVEEILIKLNLSKKGYKIIEIPISFNKRAAGESKRKLVKFIFSYIKTISRLLKIKRKALKGG